MFNQLFPILKYDEQQSRNSNNYFYGQKLAISEPSTWQMLPKHLKPILNHATSAIIWIYNIQFILE